MEQNAPSSRRATTSSDRWLLSNHAGHGASPARRRASSADERRESRSSSTAAASVVAAGHRQRVDQRVLDDLALRLAAAQRRHRRDHPGQGGRRGVPALLDDRDEAGAQRRDHVAEDAVLAARRLRRPSRVRAAASPSAASRTALCIAANAVGRRGEPLGRRLRADLADRQVVGPGAGDPAPPQQRAAVDDDPAAADHGGRELAVPSDGVRPRRRPASARAGRRATRSASGGWPRGRACGSTRRARRGRRVWSPVS